MLFCCSTLSILPLSSIQSSEDVSTIVFVGISVNGIFGEKGCVKILTSLKDRIMYKNLSYSMPAITETGSFLFGCKLLVFHVAVL